MKEHSAAINTNEETIYEPIWNELLEILSGKNKCRKVYAVCYYLCKKKRKKAVCLCFLCIEISGRHLGNWQHSLPVWRGPGVLQQPSQSVRVLSPLGPTHQELSQTCALWRQRPAVHGRERGSEPSHSAI